jgi:uncharacterized protein YcbK (DUF882 family)
VKPLLAKAFTTLSALIVTAAGLSTQGLGVRSSEAQNLPAVNSGDRTVAITPDSSLSGPLLNNPADPETLPTPLSPTRNLRQQYHLRMYHLHTGESIDVTYRVGNRYVPSALAMLDHFLRDHRNGDVANYDPHEFDVLHAVMLKLRRPNGVIDIVCGYRSPASNEYLRETTAGVAEHSQHLLAKAIDIRVPGVSTRRLDHAALSLGDGGVGYYPHSKFVHVDVGPVRQWTLM